ncbi:MAG: tripartite tricarboxylate transporter substrate-binding protein [Pseudolabrys sp.]|nr:tripartite tricarboxylate transporter substrate-binding protein [Pseudolabrys sp.]
MKRALSAIAGLFAIPLLAVTTPAQAQDFPNKPITIVVPLAAGSGMDALVRLYADKLQQSLGKPVVVENKPGASLMLAAAQVAAAPADGYTLLVSTSSAMAINLVLFKKVNYDAVKDFAPVSFYVKSPFILVVNPDLKAKTVPELIKLAKESATPLSYSSPGAGVAQHLSMEYMKQRFGLTIAHVPYRSTPQSITDIVAGHVQLGFAEAGASLPLIREGKLRALAVSSSTRLASLPDVPTFAEAASTPDFEAVSWHMLFAPAATPKPVLDKLHAEMSKIMTDPEMKAKAAAIGLLPIDPPSIPDTVTYLASEREKWGSLVRKLELEGSQ